MFQSSEQHAAQLLSEHRLLMLPYFPIFFFRYTAPQARSSKVKSSVMMSEFAPISIYLVISPLVSLIPLGLPFRLSSKNATPALAIRLAICCLLLFLFYYGGGIEQVRGFLGKVSLNLGSRTLSWALFKLGCSGCAGGLALAFVFITNAFLTAEATYMMPSSSAPPQCLQSPKSPSSGRQTDSKGTGVGSHLVPFLLFVGCTHSRRD